MPTMAARLKEDDKNEFERAALLVALGLMLGWGIGATDEPTKIGFVDAQQVIATVKEGKSAREELERKLREAENKMLRSCGSTRPSRSLRRRGALEDALRRRCSTCGPWRTGSRA